MSPAGRADWLVLRPGGDDLDRRLDRVLRKAVPAMTLGEIYSALRRGLVRVNGAKARPERRLAEGDTIELSPRLAPAAQPGPPEAARLARPALDILLEDDDFLVINKAAGSLVHGPDSLEQDVGLYLRGRLPAALAFRPGPLHRLDRNSSGVLFFSKSLSGARAFTAALREGRVTKTYLALLCGELRGSLTWSDELVRDKRAHVTRAAVFGRPEGKSAVSHVSPLAARGGFSLAEIRLDTGRTHQIRAQAGLHGHPLAGDRKYGGRPLPDERRLGIELPGGYLLHARRYEAELAGLGRLNVTAPLPEGFAAIVGKLFGIELR